jgi:ABC-type multidrug transport system fused ATPase/permease subunit
VIHLNYLSSLFRYAFKHNPLLYVSLILSVASVCIELAAMGVLMPLASVAGGQAPQKNALAVQALDKFGVLPGGRSLLLLFIGLFAMRVLTQFLSQALTIYIGRRLLLQLTSQAFSALVRNVPIKELESRSIGYYIALAGDEANRASNLIVLIGQFVSTMLLGALYFLAIASYSKLIALAVVVFLVVTFLLLLEAFRVSHRLGVRQVEQSQAVNTLFLDALNSLRSVRSYSAEDYVTTSYYRQIYSYMKTLALIDVISLSARLGPALLLFVCGASAVFWPSVGSQFLFDLPFLVTIVILLMRFFPVAGQALNLTLRIVADSRSGRDVTHMISEYSALKPQNEGREATQSTVDRIEASGVYFSHSEGNSLLQDLNISLSRGQSYAIVGRSGCGKSTLLDLILGFYNPDRGRILVNDVDLVELGEFKLRQGVLLVSQDAAIFNDTVANNLKLGVHVTQQELERACAVACIHDFIRQLPEGYETLLQYRGSNLSGGQKQRIGIARAVLRQPDVLLLDESTSALDATTREQVVTNLREEFKDRIIVFVSHDAFVISQVDHVFDLTSVSCVDRDGLMSAGDAA